MEKSFVNPKNAGARGGYDQVLKKISRDGICPFCPQNLARYHTKPILKTGRHWILTDNMYPYPDARHHLLLIHKKHIESVADMTPQAWYESLKMVLAEIKKRAIMGGTFYIRFGDTAYTGASVRHLHANLISYDINKKTASRFLCGWG